VIICVDNSDWSRNGDYEPTRWEAQVGAANILIEQKCERNPENTVGMISMAGKRVQVLSTLTTDQSRVLNAMKTISLTGESDYITSLNIAQLTLKHRQNKNQRQRIILFVCAPIKHSVEEITLVGKKLKKYNVAIDIISYGNVDENSAILKTLLDTVNNNNNSHIIEVLPGYYLVDSLFSSPIINDMEGGYDIPQEQGGNVPAQQNAPAQGGAGGGGQVGMSQFERDINIAIQNSILEEQRRKEDQAKKNAIQSETIGNNEVTAGTPRKKDGDTERDPLGDNEDEEKLLEEARLLSLTEHEKNVQAKQEKEDKEKEQFLNSEDFIKDVLKEITPGEYSDNMVKDVMDKLKKDEEKKKEETKKEEKEKKEDKK